MVSMISDQFKEWRGVLRRELKAHLAQLRADQDIYGFALAVPER